jgi:hypothetical protein
MSKPKWKPIPGCNNYAIGSNGKVKRLKHKSTGNLYRILDEMYVTMQVNRSGVVYVKVRMDSGQQKVFSVQKLVVDAFLEHGCVYYKIAPDWEEIKYKQVFNNKVEHFLRKDIYDRMIYKPQIFKTIRT